MTLRPCVAVEEVFKAAGLSPSGPVTWGTPIPERRSGVQNQANEMTARSS
jgi:hypothetical protein